MSCKLTQEEIDNLEPFDRFQYLKYGNILPTQKTIFKNIIDEDAEPVKTQAEINYEFSLEEPDQHETQD